MWSHAAAGLAGGARLHALLPPRNACEKAKKKARGPDPPLRPAQSCCSEQPGPGPAPLHVHITFTVITAPPAWQPPPPPLPPPPAQLLAAARGGRTASTLHTASDAAAAARCWHTRP